MRTTLLLTAAALALTACGPKAADPTPATTNDAAAGDNLMVPPSESAALAPGDNGMMNGTAVAATPTPDFVTKAAISDMYEIESSKLAQANATSADLKKFAGEMIAAHTATTKGLKAAIATDGVKTAPPTKLDAEHQALIDALKAAKGAEFDTLYKTQQTEAHGKTLALMENYGASGDSPAIKSFATDTAPKVKSHADMLSKMS